MDSLIYMGMIFHSGDSSYAFICHEKPILYMSNIRRVRVDLDRNELYTQDIPIRCALVDEGFPKFDTNIAGNDMDANNN